MEYFMKPECSALKEKCLAAYLLSVYLLLNKKKQKKKKKLNIKCVNSIIFAWGSSWWKWTKYLLLLPNRYRFYSCNIFLLSSILTISPSVVAYDTWSWYSPSHLWPESWSPGTLCFPFCLKTQLKERDLISFFFRAWLKILKQLWLKKNLREYFS